MLIGTAGIFVATTSAMKPAMGPAVDVVTDTSTSATDEWAIGRTAAMVGAVTDQMGAKASMTSGMLAVAALTALALVVMEVASLPERIVAAVDASLAGSRALVHTSMYHAHCACSEHSHSQVVACRNVIATRNVLPSSRWHYAENDHWKQKYSENETTPIAQHRDLNR